MNEDTISRKTESRRTLNPLTKEYEPHQAAKISSHIWVEKKKVGSRAGAILGQRPLEGLAAESPDGGFGSGK